MREFSATVEGIDNGFIVSAGIKGETQPIIRAFVIDAKEIGGVIHTSLVRTGLIPAEEPIWKD